MTRRTYKPYLILPLVLYGFIMYRFLDNACTSNPALTLRPTDIPVHLNEVSALLTRMPGGHDNISDLVSWLIKDSEAFKIKGRDILSSLKLIVKSGLNENVNFVKKTEPTPIRLPNQFPTEHFDSQSNNLIYCANIHEIQLQTKIGHGFSKQTFQGDFRGRPVAVKMVTRHQSEVKSCIETVNMSLPEADSQRSRCFVFSSMKLMKEILLLHQLKHPGFVQLLGYCVRNEESDTTDLNERGIVSVFELGSRLVAYNLQSLTWREKLKMSSELADFLDYLEHSPLGSLRVRDFKEEHFLLVNGSLKMIDLDDVDNLEPSCNIYISLKTQEHNQVGNNETPCQFNLSCQKGMCIGFNARQNMKMMNKLFFKILLFPTIYPSHISGKVGSILADIDDSAISAAVLRDKLLALYN